MATFSISMSVEVEADNYDEAFAIQAKLFDKISKMSEVTGGPYEIDVEQQNGFEEEMNDEIRVVYAQADDWQGLFINSELIMEDHKLKPSDVQAALKENDVLGVEIEFKDVDLDWMYDVGSFPNNIAEVVWEK